MTRPQAYTDLLSHLKRREGLLRILMLTVFTAFCWVGFSIFLSQQKTKIPASTRSLARPLTPAIDTKTLDVIAARTRFSQTELESFPLFTKEVDAEGVTSVVQIQDAPPTPATDQSPQETEASSAAQPSEESESDDSEAVSSTPLPVEEE